MSGETKSSELGAAESEPKAKSVWNSLEVFKLVVALLTPVLIFTFGLILSTREKTRLEKRDQDARIEARIDKVRSERQASARLAADRLETRLREAQQREQARKDAAAASLLAFQREQALLDRSAEREARFRRETMAEARRNRQLDLRMRLWDEIRPNIIEMGMELFEVSESIQRGTQVRDSLSNEKLVQIRAKNVSTLALLEAYRPNFSDAVYEHAEDFLDEIDSALFTIQRAKDASPAAPDSSDSARKELDDIFEKAGTAYEKLVEAVRRDLREVGED